MFIVILYRIGGNSKSFETLPFPHVADEGLSARTAPRMWHGRARQDLQRCSPNGTDAELRRARRLPHPRQDPLLLRPRHPTDPIPQQLPLSSLRGTAWSDQPPATPMRHALAPETELMTGKGVPVTNRQTFEAWVGFDQTTKITFGASLSILLVVVFF